MYERRLIRLNETLNSNDNKLLIRMMHTLDNCFPEEVNGHVEKDDIDKWIVFYNTIKEKYSNIKLILKVLHLFAFQMRKCITICH